MMTHDEITELLGAYALDAVDPDERAEVEDHLRDCVRCRAEVAEHRETAAFLAHAGTDAPSGLWGRIATTIEPGEVVPFAPPPRSERRWNRWTVATAMAGAAAAAVIGVLVLEIRDLDRRMDRRFDGGDEIAAAMAEPGTAIVQLVGAGSRSVPVVVTSDGQAWLQAAALPELDESRTYQLWGAAGDELISIAVLGSDPGVFSFDVSGYALLAITEEEAPGVVQSQNDPIVAGSLA